MAIQLIILLAGILVSHGELEDLPRQYVLCRDFFNVMKSSAFSVYDTDEKVQHYRIESKIHLLQTVEIVRYPEKKTIGKLNSQLNFMTYRGEFSILDEKRSKWISGTVKEEFKLSHNVFHINWNGTTITMKNKPSEWKYEFRDSNDKLLADFRIRVASTLWTPKYDVKVYSNDFPEQIYFLAIAASNHASRPSGKG